MALAGFDRDAANRRHVHAEPGRGARHERQLGDQCDLSERGRTLPERARDQDVHAEAGDHEDAEADDVLPGARQDRAAVPRFFSVVGQGSVFGFGGAEGFVGGSQGGPSIPDRTLPDRHRAISSQGRHEDPHPKGHATHGICPLRTDHGGSGAKG